MMARMTVGIVIFSEVEVLDFAGPFEVFSVTRLDDARRREEPSPFDVLLVAADRQAVTTVGGMNVLPHVSFEDCPPLDILVVPGGWGTRTQMLNGRMLAFVTAQARSVRWLTAVCTGALILGKAGLLNDKQATTHWRSLELMQNLFPEVRVERTSHVVVDGGIVTSSGIAAGIDMALTVVARCCGEEVARATARHMEYPYPDSLDRRVEL